MDSSPPGGPNRRDPITQRLLDLLYRRRKERKWSVRELAQRADISPSYVSLIENGHKVPDTSTIERLGRVLGIDEKLLNAWVTVRGRTTDTGRAIEAAHELMEQLNVDHLSDPENAFSVREMREPMMLHYSAPAELNLFPESDRFVVGIPLYEEGVAPGVGDRSESMRERRPFWIDKRMLPERDELSGAWAWRLSGKGWAEYGRGLYRRGSTVVMLPSAWSEHDINPRMVFAVSINDSVVLSRVSVTKAQIVLLPTDVADVRVVEARAGLRDVIVGRVVLGVERYW